MSDIVDKLRGAYSTVFERSLAKRAADEILRLRNHAMQDRLVLDENAREIERLSEENERLRAALRPWVDSEGGKLWVWPESARETALKNACKALNSEVTEVGKPPRIALLISAQWYDGSGGGYPEPKTEDGE